MHAVQALRIKAACRMVGSLTSSAEGREGFLQGLKPALVSDGALRAQLASVLYKSTRNQEAISGIPEAAAPRRCAPEMPNNGDVWQSMGGVTAQVGNVLRLGRSAWLPHPTNCRVLLQCFSIPGIPGG